MSHFATLVIHKEGADIDEMLYTEGRFINNGRCNAI